LTEFFYNDKFHGSLNVISSKERREKMKKVLVLTLICSLIFPVYCFSGSGNSVVIDDESTTAINIEKLIDEINFTIEDGVIEPDEIDSIIKLFENTIDPSQLADPECRTALTNLFVFFAIYLVAWNLGASTGNFLLPLIATPILIIQGIDAVQTCLTPSP
jgi:hypothetical protein